MKFQNTFLALTFAATTGFTAQSDKSSGMSMDKIEALINKEQITDLNDLPQHLDPKFRTNFILKHGDEIKGPRGHLFEEPPADKGQGTTPLKPRAILFDSSNGFSISYNGGGKVCKVTKNGKTIEKDISATNECRNGEIVTQKNSHTLDMMEFDEKTGFHLWKWDFKPGTQPVKNQDSCVECHGPYSRPVFSMYPDWPGFYGSDNDELTSPDISTIRGAGYRVHLAEGIGPEYQEDEYKKYMNFRHDVSTNRNPRYKALFDEELVKKQLNYTANKKLQVEPDRRRRGLVWNFSEDRLARVKASDRTNGYVTEYPWEYFFRLFPLRPAHTFVSTRDISRAFSHRPGLRFNILMSRYHTKNLSRLIRNHKSYKEEKMGKFFVYNLMRCAPKSQNRSKMSYWYNKAGNILKNVSIPGVSEARRKVDIGTRTGIIEDYPLVRRDGTFKRASRGTKTRVLEYERSWMMFGLQLKDIDMRYSYNKPEYDYINNPTKGVMKIGYFGTYFNAYNDGSTTTDELITANLLQDLIRTDKDLNRRLSRAASGISWKYVESIMTNPRTVINIDERKNNIGNRKISKSFFSNGGTRSDISDDKLNFWGLAQKYGRFPARYTLDREFFKKMDSLGMWMNLPYAPEIANDHHRAPWGRRTDNVFMPVYKAVCDSLEGSLMSDMARER